jgi:hypothetical protein
MSRKLRALGLTVLALCGLTALMATSAQANWLENGVETTVNKVVKAKAHLAGKLVISSLNFEIRCPTLEAEGLEIVHNSKEATGKVKFTGCKGFQISTGTVQGNCTPETTGGVKEVVTAAGKALDVKLATVSGGTLKEYILFEENGAAFSTIKLPALCALAETSNVTGSLVAECGELVSEKFVAENCSVAQKVHLLQAATPTVFFKGTGDTEKVEDKLKFGANAATLAGIAAVELASGNSWSGDA